MSILKELNPQKNEVVRIKFKTINDIMSQSTRDFCGTEEYYALRPNIKAYLHGGDFIVSEEVDLDDHDDKKTYYISVQNHLDKHYGFDVHDEVIESVEIISDAERFSSHNHGILAVRVDDEMYINGRPLIWDEDDQARRSLKRGYGDEDAYKNPNRKLLKMFENFIADLAVRDSFQNMNEGEE